MSNEITVDLPGGALSPARLVLYPSALLDGYCVAVVEIYRAVLYGDATMARRDGRWIWAPVFVSESLGMFPARDAALAWWKERQ